MAALRCSDLYHNCNFHRLLYHLPASAHTQVGQYSKVKRSKITGD